MVQASSGEQPMETNQQPTAQTNEVDEHAVPDVELLQFQKQRSTPKVKLSEVQLDGGDEIVHAEVEDFGQVSTTAAHLGMARAGSEEQVIRQLHKAGSIDATGLLPDVEAVLQETGGAATTQQNAAAAQQEEQKV